jgi:IS66 C-terminal element
VGALLRRWAFGNRNNPAERVLRAGAPGRKNYLFAGSDRGGESAGGIYDLIGTSKLNGIDPENYLLNVLSGIAEHRVNRIEGTASMVSRYIIERGETELLESTTCISVIGYLGSSSYYAPFSF